MVGELSEDDAGEGTGGTFHLRRVHSRVILGRPGDIVERVRGELEGSESSCSVIRGNVA